MTDKNNLYDFYFEKDGSNKNLSAKKQFNENTFKV